MTRRRDAAVACALAVATTWQAWRWLRLGKAVTYLHDEADQMLRSGIRLAALTERIAEALDWEEAEREELIDRMPLAEVAVYLGRVDYEALAERVAAELLADTDHVQLPIEEPEHLGEIAQLAVSIACNQIIEGARTALDVAGVRRLDADDVG